LLSTPRVFIGRSANWTLHLAALDGTIYDRRSEVGDQRSEIRGTPTSNLRPPTSSYIARMRISRISSGASWIGFAFVLLATADFSTTVGRSAGVMP